jgi:hypothetical protein
MSLILSGTDGLSDVDGSAATPAIRGTDANTGIFFPAADTIGFSEGGVEAARFDSSGNFGLGVTPTNNTLGKTVQVGQACTLVAETGSNRWWLGSNWYYNSGDKYINNGFATLYSQQNGTHAWYNAPSGTAGNAITFTQAMTLDASGNLCVGVTATAGSSRAIISGNTRQLALSDGTYNWYQVVGNNFWSIQSGEGTERARIDSSGNLLVGTTGLGTIGSSSGFQITSSGAIYSASTGDSVFSRRSANGTVITFRRDTTTVGSIDVTTTATSYVTSSDYRLKNTIAPMTGALAKVALLKPCTYKWNADGSDGQGFIAHELQAIIPDAVIGEKDAVDADGNPQYQGIDTSFLVATLTAAIQEQQALITQLTARITALESA